MCLGVLILAPTLRAKVLFVLVSVATVARTEPAAATVDTAAVERVTLAVELATVARAVPVNQNGLTLECIPLVHGQLWTVELEDLSGGHLPSVSRCERRASSSTTIVINADSVK
ncbi:MAG: hypothetical protein IPP12_00330 [Nitrospira sp.]|nr:hypothetical protein [Nitrospira sp.]